MEADSISYNKRSVNQDLHSVSSLNYKLTFVINYFNSQTHRFISKCLPIIMIAQVLVTEKDKIIDMAQETQMIDETLKSVAVHVSTT